ncbi:transport and Golgi organization protein 1 homolog isoform X6 [Anguilla anguilla]|uniref:transport and Golgi organization protein 1 homolog isoform X4 n=1 Tax=Anguilla anguilla TaxID=7936 RepID=UPI0015A9486B|nr:transport and Golgi organization protein 1 homolog isoform X4 [Anguilla anguilla]XP_035279382.1 transport and Golgi organization protein 1 homolog isoform X6 [Anguilla anguilla]
MLGQYPATTSTASMAAVVLKFYLFILLLHTTISKSATDRRFSDFKRCSDEDCSMLLCRGKAAQDFNGPDCRFLSFKKGETIYVYYKLSGKRTHAWAGSVGSRFGYFPKDLLKINHVYTDKELEVPAEETDFVCFDTGLDKFDSYDLEALLGSGVVSAEGDNSKEEKLENEVKEENADSAEEDSEPVDSNGAAEDFGWETETEEVGEDREAGSTDSSQPPSEEQHLNEDTQGLESDTQADESIKDDLIGDRRANASVLDTLEPESATDVPLETLDEPLPKDEDGENTAHVSEGQKSSKLKTTLGSTFDAVISDDENTFRVTPYYGDEEEKDEEEEGKEPEDLQSKQERVDNPKPALISFSKDEPEPKPEMVPETEPVSEPSGEEGSPKELGPEEQKAETEAQEKGGMWSSLGDKVFAIVSGGERTDHMTSSEEEEEEEEEEEDVEKGTEPEPGKPDNEELDSVELSAPDPHGEAEDVVHSSKELIFDEPGEGDIEESVSDVLISSSSKSKPEEKVEEGILSDEAAAEVEDEVDLTSSQPDSSELPADKESISLDERKPDSQAIPKDSPGTLPGGEAPVEPQHENVKLESSTQLDGPSEERHTEQTPKVSAGDIPPEDRRGGKPAFRNLNPSASGDGSAVAELGLDAETAKRVRRAKEEIKHLLEDTLKKEKLEPHPHKEEEEEEEEKEQFEDLREGEEEEELLEDENAVLSSPSSEHLDAKEEVANIEEVTDTEVTNMKEVTDTEVTNMKEVTDSDAEAEELGPEEPETDTVFEEPEEPKATDDTRETEETASGPSTEEDLKVTERSRGAGAEMDHKLANPDDPHPLPSAPSAERRDKKPDGGDEEYSDDVKRLTLLRSHFQDKDMKRIRKYLGLKQLIRLEAMFSALDQELRAARRSQADPSEDVEAALEGILEASENSILDEIERMLDAREPKHAHPQQPDAAMFDEEAMILDNFQELAFRLRQNYSTASDSEPLASESQAHGDKEEDHPEVEEDPQEKVVAENLTSENLNSENLTSENLTSENLTSENLTSENLNSENLNSENLTSENLTTEDVAAESLSTEDGADAGEDETEHVTDPLEGHLDGETEHVIDPLERDLDGVVHTPDIGFEEDGGRFNKNKENQGIYKDTEEIQKGPQAILENPLDIGFGFEVESPSSGSVDSASVSDFHEDETEEPPSSSVFSEIRGLLLLAEECFGVYAEMLIAALPEEWQPGPTFRGLPWRAVASTAAVGVLTVLAFLWRTVLAVRSKTYQLTEKQLAQRITQICEEKSQALAQISELKEKMVACEAQLKESESSASSTERENTELKESFRRLQKKSRQSGEQLESLTAEMAAERRRNQEQSHIISKTEKEIEKLKHIVKGTKDELSKVQVLMDEASIREEALKAQVTSFQKENSALKEKKKNLLREARDWEDRHRELSEKIKVLQRAQKELEDTLEHKENEIEVLSDCITELRQLEACDGAELLKGGALALANGEAAEKKGDALKTRIKQMLDVSRVKTTLSIVEEERNRYLEKLLAEEKQRHDLEEQIQKLEHDRASLQGEKSQLEGQFHTIQQKLEIMNELYQQKENALQQKLTQEEFERREKETKLTEVDGKAVLAEEELRAYKLRIQEVEEELQKTERSYKTQIAAHEKKAHDNWLNARAAERALVEEKRETANLRQKLVEVNDKLVEFQRPLFKPTPGRPDQQIPPMRRGDSYGPSPVSGGAPSPPLMMEGPGRPPSAPVGRRAEPFGRPPSEPHGRYSDLGHPLPPRPDVCVPRTSSPSALDGSRLSKSGGASFLGSPIRDIPGPGPTRLPPPPMGGPHGPPLNGHLPMIPPGPSGYDPRLPPPRPGPYGPPRPYGPLPPPYIRGPPPPMREYPMGPPPMGPPSMGPPPFGPQDFHPGMREPPHGPRDYPLPPRPLPPGARDHTGPLPGPPMTGPPHASAHGAGAPEHSRGAPPGSRPPQGQHPPTDRRPPQGHAHHSSQRALNSAPCPTPHPPL